MANEIVGGISKTKDLMFTFSWNRIKCLTKTEYKNSNHDQFKKIKKRRVAKKRNLVLHFVKYREVFNLIM